MALRFRDVFACFSVLALFNGCGEATSTVDVDLTKRATLTVRDTFSSGRHTVRFDASFVKRGPSCEDRRVGECVHTTCSNGSWSYADPGVVRVVSPAPS